MPAPSRNPPPAGKALAVGWILTEDDRNQRLLDWWSLTHVAWGAALALVFHPAVAFALMVLWEPVEIFVLSPLLAKLGVRFGYESWRNSVADIAADGIGVLFGAFVLRPLWDPLPPFL